jgi:hypothetical protein
MFQLRGPRLLQTHAIWSADESRLLCYDSRGVRFAEEHLAESPHVLDGITNPQSIQSACAESV